MSFGSELIPGCGSWTLAGLNTSCGFSANKISFNRNDSDVTGRTADTTATGLIVGHEYTFSCSTATSTNPFQNDFIVILGSNEFHLGLGGFDQTFVTDSDSLDIHLENTGAFYGSEYFYDISLRERIESSSSSSVSSQSSSSVSSSSKSSLSSSSKSSLSPSSQSSLSSSSSSSKSSSSKSSSSSSSSTMARSTSSSRSSLSSSSSSTIGRTTSSSRSSSSSSSKSSSSKSSRSSQSLSSGSSSHSSSSSSSTIARSTSSSKSSLSSSSSSTVRWSSSSSSSTVHRNLYEFQYLSYASDCQGMASFSNPLVGKSAGVVYRGGFNSVPPDSTSIFIGNVHSPWGGLQRTAANNGAIYCRDASNILSLKEGGQVSLWLNLPEAIEDGVYALLAISSEIALRDYAIWSVNHGEFYVSPPGLYAALTPDGIEFTVWTPAGKLTAVDEVSSIDANTDFVVDFTWTTGSEGLISIVVNQVETAFATGEISRVLLTNLPFWCMDSPQGKNGLNGILRRWETYSG